MIDGISEFWSALKPKIEELVKTKSHNCLRVDRFDVVSPPNGSKIGVKQPFGAVVSIPYCAEVADAKVGDTVLVLWWGSLSTAKAWCYGDGPK